MGPYGALWGPMGEDGGRQERQERRRGVMERGRSVPGVGILVPYGCTDKGCL